MDKVYVLTTMASYPALYRAELEGLPARVLRWKPSPREWSLAEVIAHLADTDEIYYRERMLRAVREENPSFPGFDQERLAIERRYNEQDPLANLARFARANARVVALGWEADWSRPATHQEEGPMTLKTLFLRLFTHYGSHLAQMRRVKRQYLERL